MKLAKDFLPICKEDLLKRNIEQLDFIIVTGRKDMTIFTLLVVKVDTDQIEL